MSGTAAREVAEAIDWLAANAHENLGTEISLRRASAGEDWRIALSRLADGSLSGVSVSQPGGQWFLDATGPEAAVDLVAAVAGTASAWPAKVTTSGRVKAWLRPALAERGVTVVRQHDLLVMVCRTPPGSGEGRWASPADRPALEAYQAAYNEERGTAIAPDWDAVTSRPSIAVLEEAGRIVAVVKRTADTAGYATMGGTWTDPACRHRGLARRVTSFLLTALLAEAPAVHLVVDDDNAPAIALYRSLDFEATGSCAMAYLGTN